MNREKNIEFRIVMKEKNSAKISRGTWKSKQSFTKALNELNKEKYDYLGYDKRITYSLVGDINE